MKEKTAAKGICDVANAVYFANSVCNVEKVVCDVSNGVRNIAKVVWDVTNGFCDMQTPFAMLQTSFVTS